MLRMKASLTQKLTGITLKKTTPDAQWDVQVRALLRATTGQREKKQILKRKLFLPPNLQHQPEIVHVLIFHSYCFSGFSTPNEQRAFFHLKLPA